MKITLSIANKIKQDFKYLVGTEINTIEGLKEIKEIVVLPINNNSFGSFPFDYLISTDKQNFILPYKEKEMSLIIFLSDNSFIYFFDFVKDNNIQIDWTINK